MKNIILILLLLQFSVAYAQDLQISISNVSNYSVPDQILGVNTETGFPYKNNSWKRWLDASTNYTTFVPNFNSTVAALGFKSFYFPGGSVARLYHYSPTGHGYCLKLNEAMKMDSDYNINHDCLGKPIESHENQDQYNWENTTSFNASHPLPPPYLEKHRDLCLLNASSTVVSVNILWSNPSELKTILDAFINNGVPVAAIVMGTEVDNTGDAVLLPNGAPDYNNKIDPFMSMLTDPSNPLHEEAYSSIPVAVDAAGDEGYDGNDWNISVSSHLSAYGLPRTGALNWWWYPEGCVNAMSDPKSCFDEYFNESLPERVTHFKMYFDQMYVVQYGIKNNLSYEYSNTFISELFPLKNLLWMIDYNAVNGEFFKGAYFMKLGTSSSYDPIWDDAKTNPIEINHSSSYDAFVMAKEIAGKKYIHTSLLQQTGGAGHSESYFFRDTVSNSGKLFILNSSGMTETLHNLSFECQPVTGQITVRTTSAAGLLTPKSNINTLTSSTQTSSSGNYNIVVPGYSILIVDFIIPTSTVTATASSSPICVGSSAVLSATGATSYSWSPSTGLSSTTGSSVTASPASTITYTLTATNATACITTKNLTVSVGPVPVITGTNIICAGASSSFDAGTGYSGYHWSTGATTQAINVNAAGTFSVTVTGCTIAATRQLTVNASPIVLITPISSAICAGTGSLLTASGASTYTWTPSTGLSASTGAAVTATPAVTTIYTVTGTGSTGCTATKSVTVSVTPVPVITGNNIICAGASSSFDAGTGYSGYHWSTGATTQAINVNAAGTYSVTVTGCTIAATRQLTVNASPTVLITPISSTICVGTGSLLTASGASTYTWTPSTGLNASTGAAVTATPIITTIYTITGTGSTGCTATKSVTVSVTPVPVITGNNIICAGASSSFDAGTGYSGYSWSTGATTQAINVNTAGTYTVTVSGCTIAATRQLTVNASPTVLITPISSAICVGTSSLLTASGASTYTWTPSTGLNASTGAAVTATPIITTIYTITGTGSTGCTATKSVTVSVTPVPVITGNNIICAGASSSFDAGTGYSGYSWSTGATTQAINVNTAGTYTVTVSGCTIAATRQLTVNASPTVLITPISSAICVGTSSLLTASGASTYTWTPSTGLNASTGAAVTATPIITTIYTVTGTGSTGCTATKSVTVSVTSVPVITGTNIICAGASSSFDAGTGYSGYSWSTGATTQVINVNTAGTYTVTVTGCTIAATRQLTVNALPTILITPISSTICAGTSSLLTASGASTYTWTPSTGLNASTGAAVTATPIITTIYTITGTGSTGCTSTKTVMVSVTPVPVITGNNIICAGASSSFDAGAGYTGYSWSTGATTQAINVNTAGTYTVTVTGCTIAATRQLTVNALPTVLITPISSTICVGTSSLLTASGASTYTWTPSTGLSVSTGAAVTATPIITTIYTVTGTGSTGCTATKSVTVSVTPVPIITGTNIICAGASSSFDAGTGYSGYSWSTGATTQAINVNTAGIYTVTVTGCTIAATRQLTVNELPTVLITPESMTILPGDSVLMTASGASTYSWSPSTGLSVSTDAAVTATPAVTTIYTVTGTSSTGCSATKSITLSIGSSLVITGDSDICDGESSVFDAGAGYSGYQWSTGETTQTINVSTAGTYTVTVTEIILPASRQLTVNPSPTVLVSPGSATIFCDGESILLTASGANTYAWAPPIGLSDSMGAAVSAIPAVTTTYTVTGTSPSGCSALSLVTVTVSVPKPIGLSTSNITTNSATLDWTLISCAVGYKVNYRQLYSKGWIKKKINTNTNVREITGLSSSTTYEWQVAAKRADGTFTKFSKLTSFTTLAARLANGSDEQDLKSNVSFFPNPTTGAFHIELNIDEDQSGEATITVFNALGLAVSNQVSTVSHGVLEQQISLDNTLTAGVYFINVNISDVSYSGRLFLQR